MKRALIAIVVGLGAAAVAGVAGLAASGADGCKRVNGHLEERQGPGPGFTAVGRLTGGIQGTDRFTLLRTSEADPSTPSVVNFVG